HKVFDPFFTTKETGKGTGLGLNIVYKIIKKHKGNISFDSVLNGGSTFIIELPVSE
ncbi:MAG TPA: ATP-binding protein, partial [bacterium]|nr:ATP-binding protein [bacterium]